MSALGEFAIAEGAIADFISSEKTFGATVESTADISAELAADRAFEAQLEATVDMGAEFTAQEFVASLAATIDITTDTTIDQDFAVAPEATPDFTVARMEFELAFAAALEATGDLSANLLADRAFIAPLEALAIFFSAFQGEQVLDIDGAISPTIDIVSAITAERTFEPGSITPTVDVAASGFSVDRVLVASLTATSNFIATLSSEHFLDLTGIAASIDMGTILSKEGDFIADITVTVDMFAPRIGRDRPLTAGLAQTVDVTADAKIDRNVGASFEQTVNITAAISQDRFLVAAFAASSDLGVLLSVDRGSFISSLEATADLSGELKADRVFAAEILASADLQVLPNVERVLSADLQAVTEIVGSLGVDRQLIAMLTADSNLSIGEIMRARALIAALNADASIGIELNSDRNYEAIVSALVQIGGFALALEEFFKEGDFPEWLLVNGDREFEFT